MATKFDIAEPMSEAEAGSIDMEDSPEPLTDPPLNPEMDMDEPIPNQTEIRFDDTGQMVDQVEEPETPPDKAALVNILKESPKEEIQLKETQEVPAWFKPYAQSQEAMAEYFEWQRQQQLSQQEQTQKYRQQQSQAYHQSPEYISQICEQNGLDAEDPVHRQLIQTRLDQSQQAQAADERIQNLEYIIANQEASRKAAGKARSMESQFAEAAATYGAASPEIIEAAKRQAMFLASRGMSPEEAISESIQFVRLTAEQSAAKPKPSAENKRQTRIDQLNSAGPGRGARSHKETGMTMAEADMLVSRGGFFPN